MAHYEMYYCFPKTVWESAIPTKIKDKLKIIESIAEDGTITYKSAPTWHEAVFDGKLGAPRYSFNWDDSGVANDEKFCIIKGEFSMKEGELSALADLGASKAYPNFSILTKSEAQTLASSAVFTGE
tara:strand:+ start:2128 stop:2505 length:378 start_codon:yes stop_codon:yes gene_type:complete